MSRKKTRENSSSDSPLECEKKETERTSVELTFSELNFLQKCISKKRLIAFLGNLNGHWRKVLKFYFSDLLVMDLYSRRVKNKLRILSLRCFLYSCIDDPTLLLRHKRLNGNIVKNISAGMANFIQKHYQEILEMLEKRAKKTRPGVEQPQTFN